MLQRFSFKFDGELVNQLLPWLESVPTPTLGIKKQFTNLISIWNSQQLLQTPLMSNKVCIFLLKHHFKGLIIHIQKADNQQDIFQCCHFNDTLLLQKQNKNHLMTQPAKPVKWTRILQKEMQCCQIWVEPFEEYCGPTTITMLLKSPFASLWKRCSLGWPCWLQHWVLVWYFPFISSMTNTCSKQITWCEFSIVKTHSHTATCIHGHGGCTGHHKTKKMGQYAFIRWDHCSNSYNPIGQSLTFKVPRHSSQCAMRQWLI